MNSGLKSSYERLIETKKKFIDRVNGKTIEQQNFKPSDSAWNMIEVMDHILVSESRILEYLKKNPPHETEYKVNLKSKLAYKALAVFYKSAGKVKMPIKGLGPLGLEWDALLEKSSTNDIYLKTILDDFPNEKINHSVFKHPVSGAMTLENTIDFFTNHFLHHFHQLNRIEKHSDYPR